MSLEHKLKTAVHVFADNGPKRVFSLLKENICRVSLRMYRYAASCLSRTFLRSTAKKRLDGEIHVLYVTNAMETEYAQTVRYRIFNMRRALKGRVKTHFEVLENGIYHDIKSLSWADIVVLMRVYENGMTKELIENAGKAGAVTVFDIDDIIFLPEYQNYFSKAIGEKDALKLENFKQEFHLYNNVFKGCEFCTASTQFIANKMNDAGKKAFVIHNGLNAAQIKIAEKVIGRRKGEVRYIGYLSGSETHNRDFSLVIPALMRILDEYTDVRIRIVGYLDTAFLPEKLMARMDFEFYMPWKKLMVAGAQNYINIAPLDIENPFCNAKSELKFFESAVAGVPTVASATDTFVRCIKSGDNGFLARTEGEWHDALSALLSDRDLYDKISKNGRRYVLLNYSPEKTGEEAVTAYESILSGIKG